MTKWLRWLRNLPLTLVVAASLAVVTGSLIRRPILAGLVPTSSMSPVLVPGDLVLILPPALATPVGPSSIVVFQSSSGTWIVHRVVGGDEKSGYVTRGDANSQDDPERVTPESIAGVVPTMDGVPLHIPGVGHLIDLLHLRSPATFLGLLAVSLCLIAWDGAHRRRTNRLNQQHLLPWYLLVGGLTWGMITLQGVATSALSAGWYQVIDSSRGALLPGEVVAGTTRTVQVRLENRMPLPIATVIRSETQGVTVQPDRFVVPARGEATYTISLSGEANPGRYPVRVRRSFYLPVLPLDWLSRLSSAGPFPAAAVVALVPTALILLLGVLDPQARDEVRRWRLAAACAGTPRPTEGGRAMRRLAQRHAPGTGFRWTSLMGGLLTGASVLCLATWLWSRGQPLTVTPSDPALRYQQEIGFTYRAAVEPGQLYTKATLTPEDLPRWQTQAEPATYRRPILTEPLRQLSLEFPVQVEFDRPGKVTATVQLKGYLMAPRLWQHPLALDAPQTLEVDGTSFQHTLRYEVDPKWVRAELVKAFQEAHMAPGSGTLVLEPVLQWQYQGDGQTVAERLSTQYTVYLFSDNHLEVEEKAPVRQERTQQTAPLPNTIGLMGRSVQIATLRQASGWLSCALFPLGLALLAAPLIGRRTETPEIRLQRLAAKMVHSSAFTPQPGLTVIYVESPQELLRLQAETQRRIIATPEGYHIVDGTVCYTYRPEKTLTRRK